MSDQSIIISEEQIIQAMHRMCTESLSPERFEQFEDIVLALRHVRRRLDRPDITSPIIR